MLATTDEFRWQAVLARDRRADGTFVYAVESTGVYCRPSCPSRRPGRERVRFFPLAELAGLEGYRACKRCRPDDAQAADPDVEITRQACQLIQHAEAPPALGQLAAALGTGQERLRRIFFRVTGISPRRFGDACRQRAFKERLRDRAGVTEALYEAGYGSSSRVYENASARLGMTPGEYRRGGHGLRMAYATAGSPLGRLLVACTHRGLCAVYLGESDGLLEGELFREFPKADITRDSVFLGLWMEAVLDRINGREPHAQLPLDVRATAFQRQVWDALLRIPPGETRTYRQIAESLGRPKAARAVGRACATNPVSVVIPCHRAVRGDGGMGGYRWGLERKQALLARERGGTARSEKAKIAATTHS